MRHFAIFAFGSLLFAQDPPPAPPAPAQVPTPTLLGSSGLRMQLPAGLVPIEKPPASVLFQAVAGVKDGFRLNLNVTAGPDALPAKIDPEAARPELVAVYQKLFTDYEFVEDGTMPVLGRPAYWISSRFTQADLRLRNFQVLVPAQKPCWCTFTARDDAYAAVIESLLAAVATLQQDAAGAPPVAPPAHRIDGAALVIDELGFRFTPPKGWKPGPAMPGAIVQCYGKSVHGFAANVLVTTAPAAKTLDEKAVRDELEQQLRAMWKEVDIARAQQLTIGGRKALLLQAGFRAAGGKLTLFYCYVPAEPQSFVLTYTVLAMDASNLRPVIEASAKSVELSPPAPAEEPKDGR